MKVPVDWDGWQMKSFKYSDFEPLSPNDPNINFNMNPNDIKRIRISCQACPSSEGNSNCPENLGKVVSGFLKKNSKRDVLVRGDKDVNYGKVVEAMVLLQRGGVDKVGLMTEAR